jgi:hypothetical protein
MTKKVKILIRDTDNQEIDAFYSKTLTRRLNKLPQGTEIRIGIKENNFAEQFVGSYIVKGLPNEPPDPDPDCPTGQHFDETLGKCVEDVQHCPPGQHWDAAIGKCIDDGELPTGEFDDFGIKMLYKTTGNKVDMKVGGNPSGQGQRYNVDHKFKNYMQIGYLKTAKGQEVIELKTDGPCHGCDGHPAPIPIGMWYEPHFDLKSGKSSLHAEAPHKPRKDYDLESDELVPIEGNINEEWIGYCVVAYTNNQGQRVIEQWIDRHPFDSNGNPVNNWVRTLRAVEKGDGKMFPLKANGINVTFPRDLDAVINYIFGKGFEAELRMHGAGDKEHGKSHGTDMKCCRVYEIIPPN